MLRESAIGKMLLDLRDPAYREYVRLLVKFRNHPRGQAAVMSMHGFTVRADDPLATIYQFKDIFHRQVYRFSPGHDAPLVIDCGANIGISCLYFRQRYPGSTVLAFEANSRNVQLLHDNLSGNGISNVTVVHAAVWTHEKGVRFEAESSDGGRVVRSGSGERVPSRRLKAVLGDVRRVDFLKMDIEGAELEVLLDCGRSLRRVGSLYVEYHEWEGQAPRLHELLALLHREGFRYALQPLTPPLGRAEGPFSRMTEARQWHIFASRA